MPSWPGARSAWPSARGERTVNVGPPGAVAGVVAPSHHRIVNGRSGNASSRRSRSTSGRASAIALLGALRRQAVGVDADDVPGEPGSLEQPDDPGRDVELAAAEAVPGGRRERVVAVVPRLAERERREPREVARLVAGGERAPAEEMAERVDGVRDVVQKQHPYQPAPQDARGDGEPRAGDEPAEDPGDDEARDRPYEEPAVDPRHDRVRDQIRRVARAPAAVGVDEEPPDVRVREAAQRAAQAVAVVDVGAVRVALAVGERVVLAMV